MSEDGRSAGQGVGGGRDGTGMAPLGALRADRRAVLRSLGVLTGAAALQAGLPAIARAQEAPPRPLWERAADKGLLFGAQIDPDDLADAAYAGAVVRDCLLLTSNEYGFQPVRFPTLADVDYGRAGQLRNFALDRDMILSGASLVWHQGVGEDVEAAIRDREAASAGSALQILKTHVGRSARRAGALMHSWNVVNEPIATDQGRADGLRRESVWFETIGPDYIGEAFNEANRASDALLFLNEYGLETGPATNASFSAARKREAVLALLQKLLENDVPIDALGVQAHLDSAKMATSAFDDSAYRDFLRDVASLGLKILVTELDVRDDGAPTDVGQRDAAVAEAYRRYLATALDATAVIAVSTWGFADDYSWLQVDEPTGNRVPRPDGTPHRPLPYGADRRRKPAWYAVAAELDAAPPRGTLVSPVRVPRSS